MSYRGGVKASDLTTTQRRAVEAQIQPTCAYLYDLSRRMQQRGWDPSDPVYASAWAAHEALAKLLRDFYAAGLPPGAMGK